MATQNLSGRAASLARRKAQVNGKSAMQQSAGQTRSETMSASVTSAPQMPKPRARAYSPSNSSASNDAREASLARRKAMSTRGKAGVQSSDRSRTAEMQRKHEPTMPATKEAGCGCGCGGKGGCGSKSSTNNLSMNSSVGASKALAKAKMTRRADTASLTAANAARLNSRARRQALSQHGKTAANAYQQKGMNSAQLVRSQNPEVSSRELAKSVRAMRSTKGAQGKKSSTPAGRRRPSKAADEVTGVQVSHSTKTTGDEAGLCRSVTGTEYFSDDVFTEFCSANPPSIPAKVSNTQTLSGSGVTSGGVVGSSSNVTGDERGNCRSVTGTEYLGNEHFESFCKSKPEPGSAKVSFSQTSRGQIVSGSKPARSEKVTGDESGTCKAVTGTPYAGSEQYKQFCASDDADLAKARSHRTGNNVGREISGIQPGLQNLTGAEKGACDAITGTPYIGATELTEVCGISAAQVGESDFPQAISKAPWGDFSIVPPNHAGQVAHPAAVAESAVTGTGSVTGSTYEQGRISGTFSLGEGKVTGTEQFRFGDAPFKGNKGKPEAVESTEPKPERVTGEGIDIGSKITGDDWDRGERVTGTEGMSAVKRNPTRRGPMSAMAPVNNKRNEEIAIQESKVTGSSGNSAKGAPITVSGGARG